MKKLLYLLICCFISVSCSDYTQEELIGVYVNNYDKPIIDVIFAPSAPKEKDTLILYEDNSFTSNNYGKGVFDIIEMSGHQYIYLTYPSLSGGSSSAGMPIGRNGIFDKTPVLWIREELGCFYYKIK